MIGSDSVSAFCMSFSNTPPSSFSMLASPNWEMLNSGWAFWRLFVAARTGLTRSLVTMSLPGISNMTFVRVLVGGDQVVLVALGVGRLDLAYMRLGADLPLDVLDDGLVLRIRSLERLALDEDGLLGGGLVGVREVVLLDLLRAAGLAGEGLLDLLRAEAVADHERGDDEGKPAEDGDLAVLGAPAPGPGSDALGLGTHCNSFSGGGEHESHCPDFRSALSAGPACVSRVLR